MRDDQPELPVKKIGAPYFGAIFVLCVGMALAALATNAIVQGWRINPGTLTKMWAARLGIKGPALEFGLSAAFAAVFALAAVVSALRLWRRKRDIVELSTDGILDRRISPQLISWRAIQDVSKARHGRERVVLLKVEPSILETINLSHEMRENRRHGIKGVPISARGLAMGAYRLRRLISRYRGPAPR